MRKLAAHTRRGKRVGVNPATCERDYSDQEREFQVAIDRYKRTAQRPFPTWSEVLEVLHSLGYRQIAERQPLPGTAQAGR